MTTVTLAFLISLFQPFSDDELIACKSTELLRIIETLPVEQEIYVSLTEEAFSNLLVHQNDDIAFQRFSEILSLLLFYDGRSELGLLRAAELAYENPRFAPDAINALAALANYYRLGRRPTISPEDLIELFEHYMKNPDLFHNARECRNALKIQLRSAK